MPSSQAATNGTAGAAAGGAGAANGNGNMVHLDEEEERLVLSFLGMIPLVPFKI